MLKNKIQDLLESKSHTVYRFWKETGVGQRTAYDLANDPTQIPSGAVLSAICKAYNVQPGDILVYETVETGNGKTDDKQAAKSVKKIAA